MGSFLLFYLFRLSLERDLTDQRRNETITEDKCYLSVYFVNFGKKDGYKTKMKVKGLYRIVAFVLLIAIQGAILPIHQIFHEHHSSSGTGKYGETVLTKYEKPCCHAFVVILEAELPTFISCTSGQPSWPSYSSYSNPEFSNLFISFSNKAPPVKTV